MEVQKNKGNFSYGFGTVKTAGAGNLSHAEKVRSEKTKVSKMATVLKAAFLAAVFLIRHRNKKK